MRRGQGDADRANVKHFRTFVLLLLVTVVATYANHFGNRFHFDDMHTIVNNSYIRSLANIPLFFTDATTFSALPANQSYRPLVSTTLAIDYFVGGGRVFAFHLSTFLLFLLQGVLMFILYSAVLDRSDGPSASRYVALVAVAWYLLHPANAETINYIIARSDSLSTFFLLLAFAIFIRSPGGRRRHLYLIPAALGCLAKPVGGVFAPLLFLYLLLFDEGDGGWLRRLKSAARQSAPAFAATLLLLTFIRSMDPPTWQAGGGSLYRYVITQPYVILHYFTTFFAPFSLSADTDWQPLPSAGDVRFVVGAIFLCVLGWIALASARARRWRPLSFGLTWFLITLLPTSLMPLAEVMNDHRLFLPYVGLTIGVTWAGYLFLARFVAGNMSSLRFRQMTTIIVIAALSGYAFGTHVRNGVWHTDETLWRDVTIKSPANGRGHMNYGVALLARNDYANAEKHFREALKLLPDYAYVHINLGILLSATGRSRQAEEAFLKALRLEPKLPEAYHWYGDFLLKQKRYNEAAAMADGALRLAPSHLPARKLLLSVYHETGQTAELMHLARETLRLAPGDKEVAGYLDAVR